VILADDRSEHSGWLRGRASECAAAERGSDMPREQVLHLDRRLPRGNPPAPGGAKRWREDLGPGLLHSPALDSFGHQVVDGGCVEPAGGTDDAAGVNVHRPVPREADGGVADGSKAEIGRTVGRRGEVTAGEDAAGGFSRRKALHDQTAHGFQTLDVLSGPPAVASVATRAGPDAVPALPGADGDRRYADPSGNFSGRQAHLR
jgi:hypothetical protein